MLFFALCCKVNIIVILKKINDNIKNFSRDRIYFKIKIKYSRIEKFNKYINISITQYTGFTQQMRVLELMARR